MSSFVFPPVDETPEPTEEELEAKRSKETQRQRLRQLLQSVSASYVAATVAERREKKDISTSRTIAVRMPIQLLHRLNAVAADAATGRSHLLRQMIADYLNSMENSGIRFNGCLLSVDKVEPTKH